MATYNASQIKLAGSNDILNIKIGTSGIEDGAVTSAKLASGVLESIVIDSDNIADGSVTTGKIAVGTVTDDRLAEAGVRSELRAVEESVFSERIASGSVVRLDRCVAIDSITPSGGTFTCAGRNFLPIAPAETKTLGNFTVVSNGDGSYTFSRNEPESVGRTIRFALSKTVVLPYGTLYYHLRNDVANGVSAVDLIDDGGTVVIGAAPSPVNRVAANANGGGHRVSHISFYAAGSFTGSVTVRPMLLLTNVADSYIPFAGVSESSVPSVPDSETSYVWANGSETQIQVSYVSKDGGIAEDVVLARNVAGVASASGTFVELDHPAFITSVKDTATGDDHTDGMTIVVGDNLLPSADDESKTHHGITVESDGDGQYTISGTGDGTSGNIEFKLAEDVTLPVSDDSYYMYFINNVGSQFITCQILDGTKAAVTAGYNVTDNGRKINVGSLSGKTMSYLRVYHTPNAPVSEPIVLRIIITRKDSVTGDERFIAVKSSESGIAQPPTSAAVAYAWAHDGSDIEIGYGIGVVSALDAVDDVNERAVMFGGSDVVARNRDVLPYVYASSNYGINGGGRKNYRKLLSMLVMTDVHACAQQVENWIDYLNGVESIDCGINLGDTAASYYNESDGSWYTGIVNRSEKPVYTVLGNHDVWPRTLEVAISPTEDDAFAKWIQPTLGVMGVSTTKPYYKVDFNDYGVSLICLNSFGIPNNEIVDGNYKTRRDIDAWSQAHVDWYVSALQSVPAGNHLIIAAHDLPSGVGSVTPVDCLWTRKYPTQGTVAGNGSPNVKTLYQDVADAWVRGTSISKTYEPTSYQDLYHAEDFPTLTVNADFSSRGAGVLACFIVGHMHADAFAKITEYDMNCVVFDSSANDNYQAASTDLPRITGTKMEDCLTVLSIDPRNRLVKLVRVGSNKTIDMRDRSAFVFEY